MATYMVNLILGHAISECPRELMRFLVQLEFSPNNRPQNISPITEHVSFTTSRFGVQVSDNHGETSRLSLVEGSLEAGDRCLPSIPSLRHLLVHGLKLSWCSGTFTQTRQ